MTQNTVGVRAHIIDWDSRRRAQLSRELMQRNVHAEIYEDVGEFLERLPQDGSILIVDDNQGDPAELFEEIRGKGRFFPLSVYSETAEPERVVDALRAGAVDYLLWPIEPHLLDRALERLVEEQERKLKAERIRTASRKLVRDLTSREHDVLVSLVSGNSNKEIAQELGISPRTVEIYRKNMMGKLGARSTAEAVRIAIYAGVWKEAPLAWLDEHSSDPDSASEDTDETIAESVQAASASQTDAARSAPPAASS